MLSHCGRALALLYDDNTAIAGVKASAANVVDDENPFIIAIGNSRERQLVYGGLPEGLNFDTLIHPMALLQETGSIEVMEGSIITAGSILT